MAEKKQIRLAFRTAVFKRNRYRCAMLGAAVSEAISVASDVVSCLCGSGRPKLYIAKKKVR